MNEIENNKQKPKVCKLAILSPLLVILGVFLASFFSSLSEEISISDWIFLLIFTIFILACIFTGVLALYKIHKSKGGLTGRFTAILGIIFAVFLVFILFSSCQLPKEIKQRFDCALHLRNLGISINSYSKENNGQYPTPNQWCDLLKSKYVTKRYFVCPSNKAKKCSYAINPNCEPNSPQDVVLLFETKDGWNQFGGSELLTTENHEGKGCNILFNDGQVKFIKSDEIEKLRWK